MAKSKINFNNIEQYIVRMIEHPLEKLPTKTELEFFGSPDPVTGMFLVTPTEGYSFLPSREVYTMLSTAYEKDDKYHSMAIAMRNTKSVSGGSDVFITHAMYLKEGGMVKSKEGEELPVFQWTPIGEKVEVIANLDTLEDAKALSASMGVKIKQYLSQIGTFDNDGNFTPNEYKLPVATKTTLGGVKPIDTDFSVDANGVLQLSQDIIKAIEDAKKSGVVFKQLTIKATTIGQKEWVLSNSDFTVGQDLMFVVNNTATLHDDMYTITKRGADVVITVNDGYIPSDLPIEDNKMFLTMAKGVKYENGVITTILAKDVVFEPIQDVPATNVQEAIEQVFVFAKGVIKTVADSLGTPFLATDNTAEMETKLTEMMAKFRVNLGNKRVSSETTNTLYELVDKILEIDTGAMQVTEYESVTAPFDWVIDLQNRRKSPDLLVTVIENIPPMVTNEIYSCLFNAGDESRFEPNNNIEFTTNVHLKNHHDYNLALDSIILPEQTRRHFLDMNQATVGDIDEMHIVEKNDEDLIQWIHVNMVGIDLPSPYRTKASSDDGINQSWRAFSDDSQSWCSHKQTGVEWIKFDYGQEFPFKAVALEGEKAVQKVEIFLSSSESDFTSNDTTGTWQMVSSNSSVRYIDFDYFILPSVINAKYLMIKYTRYPDGQTKDAPVTAKTIGLGRLFS